MRRDVIGPAVLLVFCLVYGAFALNLDMPGGMEREAFTPRTLPLGLTGLGVMLSLVLIVRGLREDGGPGLAAMARGLDWPRTAMLTGLMVFYGLALTPLGFIVSTLIFLVAGFLVLGERRPVVLLLAAVPLVVGFWALMTRVLGVYLEPGQFAEWIGL
jgi:putative tricarboxylic transport membrane protein